MTKYVVHFKKGHSACFIQEKDQPYLVRCDRKWNKINMSGWTIESLKRCESVARIVKPIHEDIKKLGDDLVQ